MLLVTKGIATRRKDATSSSWHYHWEQEATSNSGSSNKVFDAFGEHLSGTHHKAVSIRRCFMFYLLTLASIVKRSERLPRVTCS